MSTKHRIAIVAALALFAAWLVTRDSEVATSITEDFSAGTAGDTLGPAHSWTEYDGDTDLVDLGGTIYAQFQAGSIYAVCDTALDDVDQEATAVAGVSSPAGSTYLGACARMSADGENGYFFVTRGTANSLGHRIGKYTSGTAAFLQSEDNTGEVAVAGDEIKITVTGASPVVIKGYLNDVEVISYNDSASPHTTGDYAGIINRNGTPAVASFNAAVITTDSITMTVPAAYQTYQRDGSDEADIDVSGTYSGTVTNIEYQVDSDGWNTLESGPTGGTFSGTIAGVSAGWHTIAVRFSNDTGVTSTNSNVRVGDVFIVGGQSNMAGDLDSPQTYSGSGASIYDQDDAWINLTTGYQDPNRSDYSVLPRLAASIEATTGYPVGFVYEAEGGTSLVAEDADWEADAGTNYLALEAAVTASGINGASAMLWDQGERDATVGSVSAAAYQSALEAMHDALQTHAGFTFPLIAAQTGSTPAAASAADMNAIRYGQLAAVDGNGDIYLGPVSYDRANLHWDTDAEATTIHGRWDAAVDAVLYSGTNTSPRVTACTYSGSTITITYDQTLTTEATLTTAAWAVTDGNGTRTVSAASASGTQVTLTVDQALIDTVTVQLASGDTGSEAAVPENANGLPAPASSETATESAAYEIDATGPAAVGVSGPAATLAITRQLTASGAAAVAATGPAALLQVARNLTVLTPTAINLSGAAASMVYSAAEPMAISTNSVRFITPPTNTLTVSPP